MKTVTFLILFFLSLSVYAKTEAGLNLPGMPNKNVSRGLASAEAALNALSAVTQLGSQANKSSTYRAPSANLGFSQDSGALKAPSKKIKKNKLEIIK